MAEGEGEGGEIGFLWTETLSKQNKGRAYIYAQAVALRGSATKNF
jgi:hypothetical protein